MSEFRRVLRDAERKAARDNGDQPTSAASGSADLLREFRVDLVEVISEGIPEREHVPGCDPWLIRAKRYLVYAGAGVGKSIAALVIGVEVVAQEGRVVILDVENGAEEYARRLADILERREDDLAEACRERLRYYEFPTLKLDWTPEEWARSIAGADLVIFDSSRLALSSVGLSEDLNDDYAKFVNALVVPLARAGSTTMILDNRGHGDGGHARGASAKADLNEVVFELSVVEAFDRDTRGKLIWSRRRQRFSGLPVAMEQVIGGAAYELPAPIEQEQEGQPGKPSHEVYLMEKVSRVVEAEPGKSANFIEEHVEGKRAAVFKAIQALVEHGYIRKEDGPRRSKLHYPITPFRQLLDAPDEDSDDWFPTGSPTGSQGPGANRERLVPPTGSSPKGEPSGTSQRGSGSPSGSHRTDSLLDDGASPPPDEDEIARIREEGLEA